MKQPADKHGVWTPTKIQFLYKHRNGRYYARTYAGCKEKWTSLRTTVLSVAKNRIKEHITAAERQQSAGQALDVSTVFRVSDGIETYLSKLEKAPLRPNTKSYRQTGVKLLLRTWEGVEELPVRKITAVMVEEWLGRLHSEATPYTPKGAKKASSNSTGASVTTLKCALDAIRLVLDVAVTGGHLAANPARNANVTDYSRKLFKLVRREKAQQGGLVLPSPVGFMKVVEAIRASRVGDCIAAADFVQFIAFCGARKNEAINVLWQDIDFEKEQIHLRVTKNGEPRWVPMMQEMKELLREIESRKSKCRTSNESVLSVREAQGFITSACAKVGVKRFTTHALRHLFGTTCLEAGVDVRTTAAWMGHKDNGALLLRIYSHIRGQHEAAMIKKVRFTPPKGSSSDLR